ncbi:MAG: FecR family protein [Chitinophagales bacterium]
MQDLFSKYLNEQCSPEEMEELLAHFDNPAHERSLRGLIAESLENVDPQNGNGEWHATTGPTFVAIRERLDAQRAKVVPITKRTWFTSAAVILVGAFAIYNLSNKPKSGKAEIANNAATQTEMAPGTNKAVLTLADGSVIILENAGNGELTQQGNTKIVKLENGQLAYNLLNEKPTEILFNSITTPRGGQYQLTLPDGSTVWLNAVSSLRFPVAFTGRERRVEVTGEAYFEVAKNASMPFKVNVAGKGEVEVLGTHFNINSYSDESTINTTLLEGSVTVTGATTGASRVISPGEQAQLNTNGQICLNKKIDTEQVIAWKKGVFSFTNASLETILRQLSRWFDVDVVYKGAIPQREFTGEIEKKLNLSHVLHILEKNNLHFRLEGRKLVVML